ncbi:MAG: ABC transporter substrate-binding protein [Egibacteraceae bacterium]
MLALGLGDRIAGIVADPEPLARFSEEFDQSEAIADKEYPLPALETVLRRNPDFILSNYAGEFANETLGSREKLARQGVQTYQTAGARGEGFGGRNSLDQLYADIGNLGRIFGVPDRAHALIADMRSEAASATTRLASAGEPPVRVFSYDSGTDAPATSAGGLLGDLMTQAWWRQPSTFLHCAGLVRYSGRTPHDADRHAEEVVSCD